MKTSTKTIHVPNGLSHTQSTVDSTTSCDTVEDMNERDLEKKVRELEMECIDAKVRYNELMRAFQAAKDLLEYEKRKAGKPVSSVESGHGRSSSKTSLVLAVIDRANGVTSAEVFKEVNELGHQMSRQHVYNTLNRLCSEKRIEKRGESYHPISKGHTDVPNPLGRTLADMMKEPGKKK